MAKLKVLPGSLTDFKFLGGIMHLKPAAGCQISILIFEKKLWRGGLYKYPITNISRTAKFLPTLGLN